MRNIFESLHTLVICCTGSRIVTNRKISRMSRLALFVLIIGVVHRASGDNCTWTWLTPAAGTTTLTRSENAPVTFSASITGTTLATNHTITLKSGTDVLHTATATVDGSVDVTWAKTEGDVGATLNDTGALDGKTYTFKIPENQLTTTHAGNITIENGACTSGEATSAITLTVQSCTYTWVTPNAGTSTGTYTRSIGAPLELSMTINDDIQSGDTIIWSLEEAAVVTLTSTTDGEFQTPMTENGATATFMTAAAGSTAHTYSLSFTDGAAAAQNSKPITVKNTGCATASAAITLTVTNCDLAVFDNATNPGTTADDGACGYNCVKTFTCTNKTSKTFTATCQADATWSATTPTEADRCSEYCPLDFYEDASATDDSDCGNGCERDFTCTSDSTTTFKSTCQADASWSVATSPCSTDAGVREGALLGLVTLCSILSATHLI